MKQAKQTHVGRNDPCPCASGKKFKKCCADSPQADTVPSTSIDEMMEWHVQHAVNAFIAGNLLEAEKICMEVLRDNPFHAHALYLLGLIGFQHNQPDAAIMLIQKAIKQNDQDPEYFYNLATIFKSLKRYDEAIAANENAIKLDPNYQLAQSGMGQIYFAMHDFKRAKPYFEKALELNPADEKTQYFFSVIEGNNLETAPKSYVAQLFDEYADRFEAHLQGVLHYQTPEKLAALVAPFVKKQGIPHENFDLLDIGCGTGLGVDALIQEGIGGKFVGVDLSSAMIEKAKAKGMYREYHVADIAEYMRASKKPVHAIIATDVFVYVGNLEAIFKESSRLLKSGGLFAFSVEKDDKKPPYQLQKGVGRYTHARSYLEELASSHGFTALAIETSTIREDNHKEIEGYLVVLEKC